LASTVAALGQAQPPNPIVLSQPSGTIVHMTVTLVDVPGWTDSWFELGGRAFVQLDPDLHFISVCDGGSVFEAADDSGAGVTRALLEAGHGKGLTGAAYVLAYGRALLASGTLTNRQSQLVERLACDWSAGTVELWQAVHYLTREN
jgi:hypothetical protein